MQAPDTSNTLFQYAASFIQKTSRHIFLTGKAGTGKTTFLKYIKDHCNKQVVVVAPTGVAAINAGGVTMHSFFQLPFSPFIPQSSGGWGDELERKGKVASKNTIFKQMRLSSEKKEIIREMELLIIDEVSMLRCDVLDCIDTILRMVRRNPYSPFGGVQVLYIGDLFQLPPVTIEEEWQILKNYYQGSFFFHARVMREVTPLYIELDKVYRQNEQRFIDLLNRVRIGRITANDLELLNDRCQLPERKDNIITLTTHNRKADSINTAELQNLESPLHKFLGIIEGEFNEQALPAEKTLLLKEGAQVMFIKNDTGEHRRYFNGKLAVITSIRNGEIRVLPAGEKEELVVERVIWENIRYTLNKEEHRIEEEELGTFTQYPLRLAWAVTIHKSQGLTFEKAIIDAAQAFAAGQVYVALSRCTSLQGLFLSSIIYPSAIQTDPHIIDYALNAARANELQKVLEEEKINYAWELMVNLVDWDKLVTTATDLKDFIGEGLATDKATSVQTVRTILDKALAQKEVADKFKLQLKQMFEEPGQERNLEQVEQRMHRAIAWFVSSLYDELIIPLHGLINSTQTKSRVKIITKTLLEFEGVFTRKLRQLQNAKFLEKQIWKPDPRITLDGIKMVERPRKPKPVKGSSQLESLEHFRGGKSIREIAVLRNLAESTIYGHLGTFIKTGQLSIHKLMSEEKVNTILKAIEKAAGQGSNSIKELLGDKFSYNDIRAVQNHCTWLKEQKQGADMPAA